MTWIISFAVTLLIAILLSLFIWFAYKHPKIAWIIMAIFMSGLAFTVCTSLIHWILFG